MVDTQRMRRVLSRLPPPPPFPTPPPPGEAPGLEEAVGLEEELEALLRTLWRRSPALERRLRPLIRASRKRRYALARRENAPSMPPPIGERACLSQILDRAEAVAGRLEELYQELSRRSHRDRRMLEAFARSAGECRRVLRQIRWRREH